MSSSRFFFLPSWLSVSETLALPGECCPRRLLLLAADAERLAGDGGRVFAAVFAASALFFPNTMAYLQE